MTKVDINPKVLFELMESDGIEWNGVEWYEVKFHRLDL